MLLQIYTQHRRCVPRRYVADQPEPAVLETESSFQEMLKIQAAVLLNISRQRWKNHTWLLASLGCSGHHTRFPQEGAKIKAASCELTAWSTGTMCPHMTRILQPNSGWGVALMPPWRSQAGRMESSFPGFRNVLHLPPAKLGFSLCTKEDSPWGFPVYKHFIIRTSS